jgi:hypothetical protein
MAYRYRYHYRYPYTLAAGSWAAVVLGARLAQALDSLLCAPLPSPMRAALLSIPTSQHPSISAPMSVAPCLCATPARLSSTLAARAGTRIEPRRPVAR